MNLWEKMGSRGLELVAGISLDDQKPGAELLLCRYKKGHLIPFKQDQFALDEDLSNWLALHPHTPVAVSLTMEESIEGPIPEGSKNILREFLGMGMDKPQDFLIQTWPEPSHPQWGAIARKPSIDFQINRIEGLRSNMIGLYLGRISISYLLSSLPDYHREWAILREMQSSPTGKSDPLEYESNIAKSLDFPPQSLRLIAAIMAALNGFASDANMLGTRQKSIQRSWIVRGLLIGIIVGISFMVFSGLSLLGLQYISKKHAPKLQTQQALLLQAQQLELQIQEKQEEIANWEKKSPSHITLLLDQLAENCPEDIKLQQCIFRPSLQERKKYLPPTSDHQKVLLLIQGFAHQAHSIPAWAKSLKGLPFISDVLLLESHFNSQDQHYPFSLAIILI